MTLLVDSHCHLNFKDFDEDLNLVVERAGDAGVGLMVTICTKLKEFDQILAIAERYDNIVCSVGIHPHEAAAEPDVDAARLVELAQHPKVVAIGETGLDYFYEHSPREPQIKNFRSHIWAARETQLPIVIHTRDADQDTSDILTEEMAQGAFPGLLHCFSSGQTLANTALDLGLYISLSGIVTFKSAKDLQETAKPKRGKRNEPSFVVHTAQKVADLRGVEAAQLANTTTENFFRLFSKVPQIAMAGGVG
jgi:TatD DNase family protein